jgi:hypothetical protein
MTIGVFAGCFSAVRSEYPSWLQVADYADDLAITQMTLLMASVETLKSINISVGLLKVYPTQSVTSMTLYNIWRQMRHEKPHLVKGHGEALDGIFIIACAQDVQGF